MPSHAPHVMQQARKLFFKWLPRARAAAKKMGGVDVAKSGLARSILPHLSEDKIFGLAVYRGENGGFYGDLILQNMPPGVPNSMGTPVSSPRATRAEAESDAYAVLIMVLRIIEMNKSSPMARAPRIFEIFGWELALLDELLDTMAQLDGLAEGYGSEAAACERLREVLAEFLPQGFSKEAFDELPPKAKSRIISVIHVAALAGLHRYPPREAPPKAPTHEDPGTLH